MKKITLHGSGTLSSLLRDAGCSFAAPCGGHGTCGKCRISASGDLSAPSPSELALLSAQELADGVRLSCCAAVQGSAVVCLPDDLHIESICVSGTAQTAEFDPVYLSLGAAIDVGTTTLAAQLFENGRLSASAAAVNPQRAYGADVISRMDRALNGEAAALTSCIRAALSDLMKKLCEAAGRSVNEIDGVVVTGNTTMLYLLTQTDTTPLSHAPFEVTERFGRSISADQLGLPCPAGTPVYLPHCISAFVGADMTAAILSSGICKEGKTALLADIGTNGELALWHNGRLFCCSTAAGPAFEGASLSCGMQGCAGAIDRVQIEHKKLKLHTIGGKTPIGICGSGAADLIAAMLKLGIIDETGCLSSGEAQYDLTERVFLSQKDIRQIQLAKSAVCAGILTLLEHCGITPEDVSLLGIAGGFGSFLSLKSASDIGLIPAQLSPRGQVLGNAALSGAAMLLNDRRLREQSAQIARFAQTLELSASPVFTERYIEQMQFPFPT